ncbi:RNA-binding (RRM/RBD/RNP motifs) family protein [Raphanus sativus]|nr:RNA-binding (RRM/RBD/RNP motifs) family protein [Raphanus sativus]
MASSSKRKPPGDDLETEPFLKRHKETVEGLEEAPPDFVVEGAAAAAVRRKTIVVGYDDDDDHVFRRSGLMISDVIDLFKNVGQVVRVRIMLTFEEGNHAGWAFVEFASADEADKALEEKSGECEVILKKGDAYLPPKYCIDHKVWYYEEEEENEILVEQEEISSKTF